MRAVGAPVQAHLAPAFDVALVRLDTVLVEPGQQVDPDAGDEPRLAMQRCFDEHLLRDRCGLAGDVGRDALDAAGDRPRVRSRDRPGPLGGRNQREQRIQLFTGHGLPRPHVACSRDPRPCLGGRDAQQGDEQINRRATGVFAGYPARSRLGDQPLVDGFQSPPLHLERGEQRRDLGGREASEAARQQGVDAGAHQLHAFGRRLVHCRVHVQTIERGYDNSGRYPLVR